MVDVLIGFCIGLCIGYTITSLSISLYRILRG